MTERDKWDSLRPRLNSLYAYNELWSEAIGLFRERLNKKFFNPLENLITESSAGAGFTIVAVQCALIESLASFRTGQVFNHNKTAASPRYEYRRSSEVFRNFLYSDPIFENHFYVIDQGGNKNVDRPFDANLFYDNVRCGLLHEARTKNEWVINFTQDNPKTKTTFLARDGANIRIYRSVLHFRLKECVNSYCQDLMISTIDGKNLRRFFGRKLDHLFDYPADPQNFDWWIDR